MQQLNLIFTNVLSHLLETFNMQFNYATNKIINGICEYCGIKADVCEHYAGNANRPLDEKDKLAMSGGAPVFPHVYVEPLAETEKAKSVEEAQAKMRAFKEETALTQLAETADEAETPDVTETPDVAPLE